MRPTVQEQLHGACRILESVVAPSVSEPFTRTILDNLIANLRMLNDALPKVAGFMHQDNVASLRQLLTLRRALSPDLVARIDNVATAEEPDADDGSAVEERNLLLRELLAEAVCSDNLTPEMRQSIESHMIDRASRAPMRYVPTVASATLNPEKVKHANPS